MGNRKTKSLGERSFS